VSPAPTAGEQTRRPDGSMSLLVDVMTHTLDEGYAEQAARRRAGTEPSSPHFGRVAGIAVLVLLGVLTGAAVDQVRDRARASQGIRAELADEVRERSAETDRLAAEAASLRDEVASTRDRALEADTAGRALSERVRALELAAGTVAVTGPGVVLTLDDAPPPDEIGQEAQPRGGTSLEGRVLDRDLQEVVNGLWAAGAEAIAVNGVRLSSRAAIRSAGEAVLVDFRPLSPPYRVEAVGRPADLEVDFLGSRAGRYLQTLTSLSGITFDLRREDTLVLPAATEPQLRAARPVGGPP
jgi:uncharacterized protein YlxW (UPF0749 family)